jgi:hypothetical protein
MKDLTDQDYIAFLGDENTMQQMLNGKKFDYHEFVDKMTSTPVPNYAFKNLGILNSKTMQKILDLKARIFEWRRLC